MFVGIVEVVACLRFLVVMYIKCWWMDYFSRICNLAWNIFRFRRLQRIWMTERKCRGVDKSWIAVLRNSYIYFSFLYIRCFHRKVILKRKKENLIQNLSKRKIRNNYKCWLFFILRLLLFLLRLLLHNEDCWQKII